MRPKTITIAPLAKDIDAFATKQAPAASGFISMTSGAAKSDDVDRNAFCLAQTPTGGGLTMNGPLANKQLSIPRVATIYCTSDISADTYTIHGWKPDQPGVVQQEDISGPNAATVRSAKVYGAILKVSTDTAATSVVEVGQQAVGTPSEPIRVLFSASADESGVTYTLHGLNRDGKYTTETGTLPTAGAVAASVDNYSAIIGLELSSACATTISMGTASKVESKWYQVDRNADSTLVEVVMSDTASFDYTIQYTNEDIHATTFSAARQTPTSAYVHTPTDEMGSAATDVSSYSLMSQPVSAVRVAVDSFVTGSANIRITQKRTNY